MKEISPFPNWFKNTLMGFGGYCLLYIVSNYFAKHVPFIVLSYPIVLYFIKLSENNASGNWEASRAKHFFNISLSLIGFFTLILLFRFDYYIKYAGRLIIGANEIFITDNYYTKIAIYIFTLLYFVVVSIYLTIKIEQRIESFDGIGAFRKGRELWKNIFPVINGKYTPSNNSKESEKKEMYEALKYFDIAIEKKYLTAESHAFRGTCLYNLGFYFDAIEDYNKAIEKNPEEDKAFNYYMRSLIKDAIFDYSGSLADIDEAIRLSKIDTYDNQQWNKKVRTNFNMDSAASFFEFFHRDMLLRTIEMETKHPSDRTTELKYMERRHS